MWWEVCKCVVGGVQVCGWRGAGVRGRVQVCGGRGAGVVGEVLVCGWRGASVWWEVCRCVMGGLQVCDERGEGVQCEDASACCCVGSVYARSVGTCVSDVRGLVC